MKKIYLSLLVVFLFAACKKENVETAAPQFVKNTKKLGSTNTTTAYIDTIYLANYNTVYEPTFTYYDQIAVYHTSSTRTVTVTLATWLNMTQIFAGPNMVMLSPSQPRLEYDLSSRVAFVGFGQPTGIYTETYRIEVAQVRDENNNDITSQVLLIPNVDPVYAHVTTSVVKLSDPPKEGPGFPGGF